MSKKFGHTLGRDNALGLLRLVFAALVIVSHTPEILDGNRGREPLTRLFGTISFGELAVDAFFVISGYLIAVSYINSPSVVDYLAKRCRRIYPGFVISSLISLLIVAPMFGANWNGIVTSLPTYLGKIVALQYLEIPGTFPSLGGQLVNGAVWTIAYEFRCYLLVVALGVIGMFRRPWLIAAIAALMMLAYVVTPSGDLRMLTLRLPLSRVWLGYLDTTLRLTSIFLVGSLFYLWRSRITFTTRGVYVATIGLIAALSWRPTAELGVAVFGGYLIFSFAIWGGGGRLSKINNKNDISYGTYLYGWPIGAMLLTVVPTWPLHLLTALTIAMSLGAGWLSWHIIESPVIKWLSKPRRPFDKGDGQLIPLSTQLD